MRPGQEAPENPRACLAIAATSLRFNEAGARSPGKLQALDGFPLGLAASMRPGQEAPENQAAAKLAKDPQ